MGANGTADALVYTLCFGKPVYAQMTDVCVRSLRRWGGFEGDIVVVTDGSYRARSSDVRVVDVGGSWVPIDVQLFKGSAAAHVGAEKYECAALMDTDMVAIDDVSPLFRSDGETVFGSDEFPFNSMLADSCGGRLLELEERPLAFATWGINSGFLCTAGPNLRRVMDRWAHLIGSDLARARRNADQPFFNRLVLRGEVRFEALPRHLIDMPPMYPWHGGEYQLHPETRLLHFCGDWKEVCVRQMQTVAAALDEGLTRYELGEVVRRLVHDPVLPEPPAWRRAASRVARPLRRALGV